MQKKVWISVVCGALLYLGMLVGFGSWCGEGREAAGIADTERAEEHISEPDEAAQDFIKWVDFTVTSEAMDLALDWEMESRKVLSEAAQGDGMQTEHAGSVHWISLLAYTAAQTGGKFQNWKTVSGHINAAAKGFQDGSLTEAGLSEELKYYSYYREAYEAVLGGLVGEYRIQTEEGGELETRYGLKGFLPIAKRFPYSDYDDFGVSRSYGYQRRHLGHDMMGQVGTPIIAVESGVVEVMGWNQYGGWRLGIRSFDGKRYYYYAHLRKDFPYCKTLKEGSIVQAGDVIGYMGRTGYSTTENVNNIDTSHLHFGLQLIFDESQKEGNGEIWIDCYQLVRFLYQNRSEAVRDDATKEWSRKYQFEDPAAEAYLQEQEEAQ